MYTHRKVGLSGIFHPGLTKKAALHASIPLLVIHEKDYMDVYIEKKENKKKVLS
jgi:hypothetical protein